MRKVIFAVFGLESFALVFFYRPQKFGYSVNLTWILVSLNFFIYSTHSIFYTEKPKSKLWSQRSMQEAQTLACHLYTLNSKRICKTRLKSSLYCSLHHWPTLQQGGDARYSFTLHTALCWTACVCLVAG